MFLLIIFFLCWGSFLNFIAYRLVHDTPMRLPRSICPKCKNTLLWQDLIPIYSWFALGGKCRNCKKTISRLYPFIEILTLIVMLGLFYFIPTEYLIAYFIFISALIVIIRTDLETMLISRFTTLFLIPIPLVLSLKFYTNTPMLPISIYSSIKGILFGYGILFTINKVFFLITKKNGMGQGDLDLMALIGAFTGIIGAWLSLMIASIIGTVSGLALMGTKGNKLNTKIPFGPFLAIGAIIYIFFHNQILNVILL